MPALVMRVSFGVRRTTAAQSRFLSLRFQHLYMTFRNPTPLFYQWVKCCKQQLHKNIPGLILCLNRPLKSKQTRGLALEVKVFSSLGAFASNKWRMDNVCVQQHQYPADIMVIVTGNVGDMRCLRRFTIYPFQELDSYFEHVQYFTTSFQSYGQISKHHGEWVVKKKGIQFENIYHVGILPESMGLW